jgi:hypothetical protein
MQLKLERLFNNTMYFQLFNWINSPAYVVFVNYMFYLNFTSTCIDITTFHRGELLFNIT